MQWPVIRGGIQRKHVIDWLWWCSWQDAVLGGWFRLTPDGPPNMATVLATAGEIASGMAHLHSRGIVHGDLSSGLSTSTSCAVFS